MGEMKLREQIEILATLQNVDREIREKSGTKQELLGSFRSRTKRSCLRNRKSRCLRLLVPKKKKSVREKNEYCKTKAKKPWISGCE